MTRTGRFRRGFGLLIAGVLVLGLSGAEASKHGDPYKALDLIRPEKKMQAPAFTVPGMNGGKVSLADHKGKVVFLNYWATWCPPCREEMPAMERLYQKLKSKGLVVLAISLDQQGEAVVKSFVADYKVTYPIGLDPKMELAQKYGIRALPSTFLIDKKGQLAAMAIGGRPWDSPEAVALMELLLSEK